MTFLPAPLTLVAWKGGTFRQRFQLFTDTGRTTPWDLTNYTASMRIHDANETDLFSLSSINGAITLGGTDGTIDLFISATDTIGFTWPNALYSLLIDSGDDTIPLVYGTMIVRSD